MGNVCWKLCCLEHVIQPDGNMLSEKVLEACDDSFQTFFCCNSSSSSRSWTNRSKCRWVKVNIYLKMSCSSSSWGMNWDISDQLDTERKMQPITALAVAMQSAKKWSTQISLELEKMADCYHRMQGFLIFHSFGGGSGYEFTSLRIERLSVDYEKKSKLEFAIYPAPQIFTAVAEPYSAILCTHTTLKHSDCCFMVDNEEIYEICR